MGDSDKSYVKDIMTMTGNDRVVSRNVGCYDDYIIVDDIVV